VKDALAEMKGVKTLNVFINSPGGDVFEAKSIYTQLLRFDAEKVVHVDGIAASAATLVAMAGDRIITSAVGTWMVHEAWSGAMGNAGDMRAIADVLDLESQIIADTYAKQTGKAPKEMRDLMLAETWMNADQALEQGFTDEISHDDDDEEGDEEESERAHPLERRGRGRGHPVADQERHDGGADERARPNAPNPGPARIEARAGQPVNARPTRLHRKEHDEEQEREEAPQRGAARRAARRACRTSRTRRRSSRTRPTPSTAT
jgi:ATP-dependent protease ClpP protease subunit